MRFILICGALAASGPSQSAVAPTKRADPTLSEATRAVRETLKDGDTAKFRLVRKGSETDRKRVCGEVNAKNSYGGYVGFQHFVYFPATGEVHILDEDFASPTYVREQAELFGSCF